MEDSNSDSLVSELKSMHFQVALDIFKKKEILLNGNKEYTDLFLMEQLFPVLLDGLERLSKEVEQYLDHHNEIDPEVRGRFNPCIFLAQFLLRNNPKFNEEKKNEPQYKQILEYVRAERFNRYFTDYKAGLLKFFLKCTQKDKATCDLTDLRIFAKELDQKVGLNNKLNEFLLLNKNLNKIKNNIPFDTILQEIIRYCSQNQQIKTSDFDVVLK